MTITSVNRKVDTDQDVLETYADTNLDKNNQV